MPCSVTSQGISQQKMNQPRNVKMKSCPAETNKQQCLQVHTVIQYDKRQQKSSKISNHPYNKRQQKSSMAKVSTLFTSSYRFNNVSLIYGMTVIQSRYRTSSSMVALRASGSALCASSLTTCTTSLWLQ